MELAALLEDGPGSGTKCHPFYIGIHYDYLEFFLPPLAS